MTQLGGTDSSAVIPAPITIAPGDQLYNWAIPYWDGSYQDLQNASSSGPTIEDTWNDLIAAYGRATLTLLPSDWGTLAGDGFEITLTGESYRGNNITYVVLEDIQNRPADPSQWIRSLVSDDWIISLFNDPDGGAFRDVGKGSFFTTTSPSNQPTSYFLSSSALSLFIIHTITSATYDATTGVLSVTGTNIAATADSADDIEVSKLTITGEGGSTYTLTDSTDVEITSNTAFAVTLSATDKAALNQIVNKNGSASTSNINYNLAAANNWNPANTDAADLTGNGITVSNVDVPAITSASYDSTGTLVVTGTGFLKRDGATNDIDVSRFTITSGSETYTLTTSNVEITSGTSFSVILNSTDQTGLSRLLNKSGT